MKLFCIVCFMFLSLLTKAQQKPANKPPKLPPFCGWTYNDSSMIRKYFDKELQFLNIADKDTIVDIGASSGAIEGILSVIGNFTDVHFVLVDIDSNCLNRERVNNMVSYYSQVKGDIIQHYFQIVHNTPDSLYLSLNRYKKVWLLNTLHEIRDKDKMVNDIANVLQAGGELILFEVISTPKHLLHKGCNKPLLTVEEMDALFSARGFRKAGFIDNPLNAKRVKNSPTVMARYIKN